MSGRSRLLHATTTKRIHKLHYGDPGRRKGTKRCDCTTGPRGDRRELPSRLLLARARAQIAALRTRSEPYNKIAGYSTPTAGGDRVFGVSPVHRCVSEVICGVSTQERPHGLPPLHVVDVAAGREGRAGTENGVPGRRTSCPSMRGRPSASRRASCRLGGTSVDAKRRRKEILSNGFQHGASVHLGEVDNRVSGCVWSVWRGVGAP